MRLIKCYLLLSSPCVCDIGGLQPSHQKRGLRRGSWQQAWEWFFCIIEGKRTLFVKNAFLLLTCTHTSYLIWDIISHVLLVE